MAAGFHLKKLLNEPKALAGLPKGLGPLRRNAGTVLRDLKQLLLSYRVCTSSRLFFRQRRIALCIPDHCRAA